MAHLQRSVACAGALAAALCMFGGPRATAQAFGQSDLSYGVQITATKPVLVRCSEATSCFRVFFNITTPDQGDTGLAAIEPVATAFNANGSACQGHALAGLSGVSLDMAHEPDPLPSRYTVVNQNKPASFVAQFTCDGSGAIGDSLSLQLVLAVLPGAALPPGYGRVRMSSPSHLAHWRWEGLELALNAQGETQARPGAPPRFGITSTDVTPAIAIALRHPGLRGLLITKVIPGSIAERSGLQAGDIVIGFGGPVSNHAEIAPRVQAAGAGQKIPMVVLRGEHTLSLDAQF